MRKLQVLESIEKLPDEFSIEEVIDRLIVLEKIERGQRDVKEGKVRTEDEARKRLSKWLK